MREPHSEPSIDIAAGASDDRDRRLVAPPDADGIEIDKLSDSVRILRAPRAQTQEREMLKQPWIAD